MDKEVKPYPPQPFVSKWLVVLMLFAIAGCARTPQVAQRVPSDRFQVAETALRHMMEKYGKGDFESGDYSACVIYGGELTSQLVAAFPNHKPKVVANVPVSTEAGVPIDESSGERVDVWVVKVDKIDGNQATAKVSWKCGALCGSGFTVELVRKDGRWSVDSEKLEWIQ